MFLYYLYASVTWVGVLAALVAATVLFWRQRTPATCCVWLCLLILVGSHAVTYVFPAYTPIGDQVPGAPVRLRPTTLGECLLFVRPFTMLFLGAAFAFFVWETTRERKAT